MGKTTHLFIFASFLLAGCMLDRSGTAVLFDSGVDGGADATITDASHDASDATVDASQDASFDSSVDSGELDSSVLDSAVSDAFVDADLDSGLDAGIPDSGMVDSGHDADLDSGIDAGPPRILVFEFERTLSGGPVRSFWTREGSGSWRAMCSGASIRSPRANVWQCTYDRNPLVSRGEIRFYADFTEIGVSPACGFTSCLAVGIHRLFLDGVQVPPLDIAEVDSVAPHPPAGMIRVKFYVTP